MAIGVLTVGVLTAGQLPVLAAGGAVIPAITITATSKFKPITGDVVVVYHGGTAARARIHGKISGASNGEVAKLYAQRFPYSKAAAPVGSVTLTGASMPYSFTVAPILATRYQVKLFATSTSTTPLATSKVKVVYVVSNGSVKGGKTCARPVCRETFKITVIVPATALKTEMAKHVYPYFGINLGSSSVPPPPKYLHLNAGHATVSKARKLSAGRFQLTIKYSFTIGNHSYNWAWLSCTKDAVSKDGLGLPGHHGCGAKRIRRTVGYLG